jgi:hypothetical protein
MRDDPRVEYQRHAENIGGLQNMIYGMGTVTTQYFNILCDDDLLMPNFMADTLAVHQRASAELAFVSARVITVDESGAVTSPYPHPEQPCQLTPPASVGRCLRFGISMPGALYRTGVMARVGPPRVEWWNWTESGWTALAAASADIAFVPAVGAIVYVHQGSSSHRMDPVEFRLSWFRMMAEVRRAAGQRPEWRRWWTSRMQPLTYARLLGAAIRLADAGQGDRFALLRGPAVAAGVNRAAVSLTLRLAQAVRALGIGAIVNRLSDLVGRDVFKQPVAVSTAAGRSSDSTELVRQVVAGLNQQAGLSLPG